ncbi:MAG: beta-lactamase family protein, partial [Bacteroidota bacterium]|nr:beta-lactamase family protein [Bacteroidota bacterium]
FGFTDILSGTKATPTSLFRLASMTKSFTAMAIVKLRDEGKLSLDDPDYKYIPEMQSLHYLTSDAPPITIRHLLTHAAGFPEDNPWGDRQLEDSDEQLISLLKNSVSFSNVPGVAYEYSNLAFALLGHIVTKVSGKPYEQYITENILLPLGMNHTQWEYTKVPPAQLAHGYRWLNKQWIEQPLLHDGSFGAMGGLITSIEDFSKYIALHQSATPPTNNKETGPVKRSSLREMEQPWNINTLSPNYQFPNGRECATNSAYCYGLRWMKDCDNKTYVGHSGGLPGFGSEWKILPDYGIGIVSFANLTYAPMSVVNLQVLDTIIKLAQLSPRQLLPSQILQQRRDELMKLLPTCNGAQQSGLFAQNFFMDYSIDVLQKEATNLFENVGKIIKVDDVIPLNQLRGSFVVECEKKNLQIEFTLTPENPPKIQEYHIRELKK